MPDSRRLTASKDRRQMQHSICAVILFSFKLHSYNSCWFASMYRQYKRCRIKAQKQRSDIKHCEAYIGRTFGIHKISLILEAESNTVRQDIGLVDLQLVFYICLSGAHFNLFCFDPITAALKYIDRNCKKQYDRGMLWVPNSSVSLELYPCMCAHFVSIVLEMAAVDLHLNFQNPPTEEFVYIQSG